ncbi:transaldolase [Xanthobacter agilis]|uniref:Transaldolase n=1 Tax=Xanthobacter agilis TaxID=47492 RepID=A0ABU0LER1_XANAG|nr:transaldolase [Xanthobacter agilis]MDQ0505604.1 transaldolase [Xanthobacter agilis]
MNATRGAAGPGCSGGVENRIRSEQMRVTFDMLKVKLFTDGADKAQIMEMARHGHIAGFTTNPSLLRKAGVTDYAAYARDLVAAVPDRPISFEVIADDVAEMRRQARLIAEWGPNVYVKLPVSTTRGEPLYPLVRELSQAGVKVNLTAVFDLPQVDAGVAALAGGAPACISVFAGRLADMGLDYAPAVRRAVDLARATTNVEVIWASTREVWNVIEADRLGCHIITAPADVLKKLPGIGSRSAAELSLDAVRAFRADVEAAGLTLPASGREAAA